MTKVPRLYGPTAVGWVEFYETYHADALTAGLASLNPPFACFASSQ